MDKGLLVPIINPHVPAITIQESWLKGAINYDRIHLPCIWSLRAFFNTNNIDEQTIRDLSKSIYDTFEKWSKEQITDDKKGDSLVRALMGMELEKQIYELTDPPQSCFSGLFEHLVFKEAYAPATKIINGNTDKFITGIAVIALKEFAMPKIPKSAILEFMSFQEWQIIKYTVLSRMNEKRYRDTHNELEELNRQRQEGLQESIRARREKAEVQANIVIDEATKIWKKNPHWSKSQILKPLKSRLVDIGIWYKEATLKKMLNGLKEKINGT